VSSTDATGRESKVVMSFISSNFDGLDVSPILRGCNKSYRATNFSSLMR
jgi:hypothetical protein